jgi:3-deoxy-D-manno-octulosonate 8-phosphate phosphatase (KDO 8-P phosphatase)
MNDQQAFLEAAARIGLLVLDVDGVLTDGRLYYDAEGREFKSFNVRDGLGIKQVMRAGITVAVISGRKSAATAARMAELGVPHVFLGRDDKDEVLAWLLAQLRLSPADVACIGDDVTDLGVMDLAGLRIAVADAHPTVMAAANWRTTAAGGNGAVREVCDLLVAARGGA